jgi:hypothetical protein
MNTCVLRILERKDGVHVDGVSGMYIMNYDPTIDADFNYLLTVCDCPEEAKIFLDPSEAHAYYKRTSPNYMIRSDGEPNRPLTSWHVQVVPFDIKQ